jgi:hypothetical protein
MACLKNNGVRLGVFELVECRLSYMSNGHVLKNTGSGWKKYKKVKAGLNPAGVYAAQVAFRKERDTACPNWAAYRDLVCATVPLALRWKLHASVRHMPGDADGVWSEMNDSLWRDVAGVDLCDCIELCRLFELGRVELQAYRAARAAAEAKQAEQESAHNEAMEAAYGPHGQG